MPKNFDEIYSEDREFVLGGETFHWHLVHWRAQTNWVEEAVRRQKEEEAAQNGDGPPVGEQMEDMVKRIVLYIVPEERERFAALVDDGERENPVTVLQLNELLVWLTEVQTNRPTETPSPSGDGLGRTGVTSPAA